MPLSTTFDDIIKATIFKVALIVLTWNNLINRYSQLYSNLLYDFYS